MMIRGSSALDRASSAINRAGKSRKGRKSLQDSETSDDAAELNQFLAGLSQKTGAGKTQDKKYAVPAGLSDISISSDDDFRAKAKAVQPAPAPSIGGSKFLKSAKTPTDSGQAVANYSASLPQKSVTSAMGNQSSPALLRLSQQAQKFMKSSPGGSSLPRKSANSLYISEDTTIVSETSESIGGNMNKFLKSKQAPAAAAVTQRQKTPIPAVAASLCTSTEDDSDMAAYIRGLSPSASEVSEEVPKTLTGKPKTFMKTPTPAHIQPVEVEVKDDSSFATESFSEGSAAGMTRSYSRQQSTAYSYTEPKTEDFESEIATESEGPMGGGNLIMDMSALSLEPAQPIAQSSKHSLNVDKKKRHSHHRDSRSSPDHSQPSRRSSKSKKHKKERKKSRSDDAYGTLDLMSVDDLMQTQSSIRTTSVRSSRYDNKSIRTESSIKSYRSSQTRRNKSVASSTSSIHTYKESVRTESIDSEIKTHSTTKKVDYDSDFHDTLHETESIRTDDGSRSAGSGRSKSHAGSYSSEYSSYSRTPTHSQSRSPSYSRSPSPSRRYSSETRSRSRSRSKSLSRTRSTTGSRSRSSEGRRSQSDSESRTVSVGSVDDERTQGGDESAGEYNVSFEDHTDTATAGDTTARSPQASDRMIQRSPCADASIQTGLDLDEMILKYYWMSELAIPTPSAQPSADAEANVMQDPPKIARMAVSNEALDVLTTYNPAMLALNDMMKQQIDLSRQFLDMQRDMHKNIMCNIEKEHYYTTLEETKQYIESKRKPRLTFEEALSMVKEEMGV